MSVCLNCPDECVSLSCLDVCVYECVSLSYGCVYECVSLSCLFVCV